MEVINVVNYGENTKFDKTTAKKRFVRCHFEGSTIGSTYFEDCEFVSCVFKGCEINLLDCDIKASSFVDANIFGQRNQLTGCKFAYETQINLQHSKVTECKQIGGGVLKGDLYSVTFQDASFQGVRISADFSGCHFDKVDFTSSTLSGKYNSCTFKKCWLERVTLGCQFETCEFSDTSADGLTIHTIGIKNCNGIIAIYLPGMSSRGSTLMGFEYEKTWMFKTGCFWGSLQELRQKAQEEKKPVYVAVCDLIEESLNE